MAADEAHFFVQLLSVGKLLQPIRNQRKGRCCRSRQGARRSSRGAVDLIGHQLPNSVRRGPLPRVRRGRSSKSWSSLKPSRRHLSQLAGLSIDVGDIAFVCSAGEEVTRKLKNSAQSAACSHRGPGPEWRLVSAFAETTASYLPSYLPSSKALLQEHCGQRIGRSISRSAPLANAGCRHQANLSICRCGSLNQCNIATVSGKGRKGRKGRISRSAAVGNGRPTVAAIMPDPLALGFMYSYLLSYGDPYLGELTGRRQQGSGRLSEGN
jgi:hypothetical protein